MTLHRKVTLQAAGYSRLLTLATTVSLKRGASEAFDPSLRDPLVRLHLSGGEAQQLQGLPSAAPSLIDEPLPSSTFTLPHFP